MKKLENANMWKNPSVSANLQGEKEDPKLWISYIKWKSDPKLQMYKMENQPNLSIKLDFLLTMARNFWIKNSIHQFEWKSAEKSLNNEILRKFVIQLGYLITKVACNTNSA